MLLADNFAYSVLMITLRSFESGSFADAQIAIFFFVEALVGERVGEWGESL